MNNKNPFIDNLLIDVGGKIIDYFTYIRDKSNYDKTGEPPTIHLERDEKVYFYTKRKKTLRNKLSKMSANAAKLLLWIITTIEYGEDFVKFSDKEFIKETNVSRPTLRKAKQDLIDNDIIAIWKRNYYWINPAIIFKGSRVKKFPNNLDVYQSKSTKNNSTSNNKVS